MVHLESRVATFVVSFSSRVPLTVQAALPALRRAAECHPQGSYVAENTIKASMTHDGQLEVMFTIRDSQGAILSRWWLRRQTLPVPVQDDTGVTRWDGKGCTLAVRVGGGLAVSSSVDSVVLSLGDILSMGFITKLELVHVVLQPTSRELAPYLVYPLPLKVLRVRHSQLELNELLTVMNTNSASLTKVEASFIALPTLQVFGLCPLLSELELQGASIGSAQMGVGAPPRAPTIDPCYRPFSDLAPLSNLFRLDLSKCAQGLNLSGLRFCHSLRVINMSASMMSQENVADLGRLSQVTDLLLSKTRITDVHDLSQCEHLAHLQLAGTLVTTGGLKGLGGLRSLRHLDLSNTPVDSVKELCSSESLTTLILWKSRVTTDGLRGIERVPTLEHLNVGDTPITAAGFLGAAPSLRLLNIQNTLVTSAGMAGCGQSSALSEIQAGNTLICSTVELSGCVSLKKLDLCGARVDGEGLVGLASLSQLEELILSNTDVDNVQALTQCTALRVLELKHVKLSNSAALAGLEKLPHLTKLLVTHCGVDSVNDFGQSKTLRVLNLWSTKVTAEGIQGLSEAEALEEVDLAETLVSDVSSLLHCHQLRGLTLYSCPLTSVEGVEGLRFLRRLDIANTHVVSICCLRTCLCLEVLNISDTKVDDSGFRGVGRIRSLKSILLNNVPVTSIGELGNCPHLEEVHAGSSSVTTAGLYGIQGAVNLQKLNLAYAKLDSGITWLVCLHHLKKLYLKGSGATASDVEYLQRYMPNCRISQDSLQRRQKERAFFPQEEAHMQT